MADEILKRDQNHVTVLAGVTDNAAQEIRMFRIDPVTGRLKLSISGIAVAATIEVGTTTTIASGLDATVTNSGSTSEAVFDFEIPKGSTIYSTFAIPDNSIGMDGDWAFSTAITAEVYYKTAGVWGLVNSLQGPQGDQGDPGATGPIGITWKGPYAAGTPYVVNDGVSYNGSSYICIQNGTGQTPDPAGTAYWNLVALKGTDGEGSGDVMGPATNTADYIPQWNGTNSKTLKDGLPVTNWLKTDQTTSQSIINGSPKFTAGINAGSADQFDVDNLGNITTSGWEQNQNFNISKHYTGFPRPATTTLAFNDGTYTLSLTASDDKVWIDGIEYNIDTLTKALSVAQEAVSGLYWFWITAPLGVPQLNCDISAPGFDKCLVATVYWNTTTNKGIVSDERHWMGRDQWMHEYLHETVGARYASGMTGTFDDTTISIEGGEFYDEDIEHDWTDPITTVRVMYHNGDADWVWDILTTPYKVVNPGVDNNLRYNNVNALATVDNNKYVNQWIYATGDVNYPIQVFIGTAQYVTLALARAAQPPSFGSLATAENKLIYRITYQNNGGTPDYQESLDYRTVSTLPGAYVATDHGTLTGLTDLDHPASAIINTPAGDIVATTVQAAINELDTEKAPKAAPTFATSITGSYLTASELLITNASSQIISAPVATYPSLTELSYVKGVTSSIQTQLNGKQATLTNPVTGTGTTNEIAYWSSSSAIGTLAVATYPSLTELSYVKGVTSAIQTQLGARLPLAGGTMTGKIVSSGSSEVGKTYTPATGAQTVALDCALNNVHIVTGNASGTAITFTVANATNSQIFMVSILQGAAVSTITAWFATIRWAGGTAPTLTAVANKRDTFIFIRTGADTYDGFIVGQNA